MSVKNKFIRNAKAKLLATSALVSLISAPAAHATPDELSDGIDYNVAFFGSGGLTESNSGTTSSAIENLSGYHFIGNGTGNSLEVVNSGSTLNLTLLNDTDVGSGGLAFGYDIVTHSGSNLNLNVNSGLAIFQGNITGSTTMVAGGGNSATLIFATVANQNNVINSSIDAYNSSSIVDMIVRNEASSAGNTITFTNNIGSNQALTQLTIGDAGSSNTNNVVFDGDVHANSIYLGQGGTTGQTNNVTFDNNGNTSNIYGNIFGYAEDTNVINVTGNTNLHLHGDVTGINNLNLAAGSTLNAHANYNGGTININGSGVNVNFDNADKDGDIANVSANITSASNAANLSFDSVHYTGTVDTTGDSDGSYINMLSNNNIAGTINLGSGNDYLISSGAGNVISGSIDFGAGNDTFAIADDSMTVTGALTNLENLEIDDNATLILGHDVSISNTLTMYANTTLQIQAGVTMQAASMVNFSQSATYIFDIASPTSHGYLALTDGALDFTGATLKANVTGADNLFTVGTAIKVASGDGTLKGIDGNSGQARTQIIENSALFSIYAMDGSQLPTPLSANDLYYVFAQDATITEIANTPINKAAGTVLDTLTSTSDPQLSTILGNIAAADATGVNNIISKLVPAPDLSGATGSQNFVNNTLDVTSERIASLQYGNQGMAAGNGMSGIRPWSQIFGQRANQGERGGTAGYNVGTYGAAFGFDTDSLVENAIFGTVFSYGNSSVSSRNTNTTDSGINSYQMTLYGNYSFNKGSFLKGMAAYAFNQVESTRHDVGGIGLSAKGDYDASIYTMRAEGGHDFKIGDSRITPSLMAHYSHYVADGYTEKGAGGAGLSVSGNDLDVFEVGAGIETGWDIKSSEGGRFAPELRAGYRYDLVGDNVNISSSFIGGGSAFNTQGVSPARGTLSLGGGLTYYTPANWELSANYEFEHKQEYTSNSGFLRAAYKF